MAVGLRRVLACPGESRQFHGRHDVVRRGRVGRGTARLGYGMALRAGAVDMTWHRTVGQVKAVHGRQVGPVLVPHGWAGQGSSGQSGQGVGPAGLGATWQFRAGRQYGQGTADLVRASFGGSWQARRGWFRQGEACWAVRGSRGSFWFAAVRHIVAVHGRHGVTRRILFWQGPAMHGRLL